jgi:hypothetical protein
LAQLSPEGCDVVYNPHDQRVSEKLKKMESSTGVLKNEEKGPLEISGSIRLVMISFIQDLKVPLESRVK